jgi:hypothetical protein
MEFMKKLALKKIHLGLAGLIIFFFIFLAAVLVGYTAFKTESAIARSGTGIRITSSPIKCVLDPDTNTCPNCSICGDNSRCGNIYQVRATFISGINNLYKKSALCLTNQTPPNGGNFRSGNRCLGFVAGGYPNVLRNFGCSR